MQSMGWPAVNATGDQGEAGRATESLLAHASGDERAADRLLPQVYGELRGLAGRYLRRERPGHSLQPTALVHEAYMRMVDITRIDWRGKTHFFALAATQMRRILVEHARARDAAKRGGRGQRVTLQEAMALDPHRPDDVLALDQALTHLAQVDPRGARVVELRLFAGLQVNEVAEVLGISARTVKGDWQMARAWLSRELQG
jgi:RNA polymerase sigma-70 factor (ECF subfamily)